MSRTSAFLLSYDKTQNYYYFQRMSTLLKSKTDDLIKLIYRIRFKILSMARSKKVHIGSALSIVEILTLLYFYHLQFGQNKTDWSTRDHFILSKGHGALALYATLSEVGLISPETLEDFGKFNSILAGHPILGIPGVEVPTGSLGHGLAIGAGMALAAQIDGKHYKTVVLMGDGELNEGSVWETALFASHWSLSGLIAIVDCNGYQQEGHTTQILNTSPLEDKWRAFGWHVLNVDGHEINEVSSALSNMYQKRDKPSILLAKTIKGKGVDFMENNPQWHMGWLKDELFDKALASLNKNNCLKK